MTNCIVWPNNEPITISVVDATTEKRWHCLNCKRGLWLPDVPKCICPLCHCVMIAGINYELQTTKSTSLP